MNGPSALSWQLATLELQTLSDLTRQNAEVLRELDHVSTLQEDGVGGDFEKSLRVKRMIDEVASRVQTEPTWETLAVLLRSEYRLWQLNVGTAIRVNPFLSHWVEAIQKLDADTQGYQPNPHNERFLASNITYQDVAAARLEMLKELLKHGGEALMTATPRSLYTTRFPPKAIDIRPFIRMLEEEGIYERGSAPPPPSLTFASKVADEHPTSPSASSVDTPNENNTDLPDKPPPIPPFKWKESILLNLETSPTVAVHQLTHLPIAIVALDFLTTLVTGLTLAAHGIDAKSVVLSFVQHALRIIEYVRQPPGPTSEPPPHQTDIGMSADFGTGRDAQVWAVRVLLVFLKNLIKKCFVDVVPDHEYTLYYDIQEICTQYLWMADVREFKAWIDRGRMTEDGYNGL
jgi:hypothetical protein